MPERNRYFTAEDPEVGLTRSQLKRASRARQLAYMKHWFETYYEDPAHRTPREDKEFIYIWGGPYDAHEELGGEFGGLLSDERIEEAVDLVQSEGTFDWAPSEKHPAYLDGISQDEPDEEHLEDFAETIENVLDRLRAGFPVSFGSREDLAQRAVVRRHLEALRAELDRLPPSTPGKGHNNPPSDDDEVPSVLDVVASIAEIDAELDKPEPDAVAVVAAASRISRAGKWLKARFDKAVEKDVEDAIRWTWKAAWRNKESLAGAIVYHLPGLMDTVADTVVRWAQIIGHLF